MSIQVQAKDCYIHKLLTLQLYGIATLLYVPATRSVAVCLENYEHARAALVIEADEWLATTISYLMEFDTILYTHPAAEAVL